MSIDFQKLKERAMDGNVKEDGDCLIWTGRLSYSNGHPKHGSLVVRRVVWQAENGPLKPKQLVTVTCGNPKCLAHLALTTKSEVGKKSNADPRVRAIKRMKAIENSRKKAKLDMDKARAIRLSDDNNHVEAAKWGVSHGLVSKIRMNKAWQETAPNPFAGLGAR